MIYLLRNVHTNLALEVATIKDNHIEACTHELVGGVLPHDVMRELTFPISSDMLSFGIGLTSSADIASAAYLASRSLVEPLLNQFLTIPNAATFHTEPLIQQSYGDWMARVDDQIPLISILHSKCSQRILKKPVHAHTLLNLPLGDARRQEFRSSLSALGAKDWLKISPTPGLGTHICNHDFKLWLNFFCRIPLLNAESTCPRCGCKVGLEKFGDHLLHCQCGFSFDTCPRTRRQDAQVRLVASNLRKASLSPTVDTKSLEHRSSADIEKIGTTGYSDFLDVTIVHLLAESRISSS